MEESVEVQIRKQIELLGKIQAQLNKALVDFRRVNPSSVDTKTADILESATRCIQIMLTPSKTEQVIDPISVLEQTLRNLESVVETTSKEKQTTGWLIKETKEISVNYPIHTSLKSLIASLKEKIASLKAGAALEAEALGELKADMKRLKAEVGNQLAAAQQQGIQQGRGEVVGLLAQAAEEDPALMEYLARLKCGDQILALMPAQNGRRPVASKVKTDDTEHKKLVQFVGEAKSKVIDDLVVLAETSESNTEKLIISFLIFQLMLHKNDKTIKNILADAEKLFADASIKESGFIMKQLESHKVDDVISHAPFTTDELTAFTQLVGSGKDKAIYLPNDAQAYRVFKTLWAEKAGKKVRDPLTEPEYIEGFKSTIAMEGLPALEADAQTPAKPKATTGNTPFWNGQTPAPAVAPTPANSNNSGRPAPGSYGGVN